MGKVPKYFQELYKSHVSDCSRRMLGFWKRVQDRACIRLLFIQSPSPTIAIHYKEAAIDCKDPPKVCCGLQSWHKSIRYEDKSANETPPPTIAFNTIDYEVSPSDNSIHGQISLGQTNKKYLRLKLMSTKAAIYLNSVEYCVESVTKDVAFGRIAK